MNEDVPEMKKNDHNRGDRICMVCLCLVLEMSLSLSYHEEDVPVVSGRGCQIVPIPHELCLRILG